MFTYKGYTYTENRDWDEDKSWYIHEVTRTTCGVSYRVPVDYSQYTRMTEEAFKTLVDLDFPSRPVGACMPWTSESLKEYVEELEYTKEYTIYNESLTDL